MWGRVVHTSIYAIHEHCQEWEGLKCKRTADWRAAQHRAGVHCCADSHTGHSLHSQGNKALKNLDLTYHVGPCWFGFANYSTQEWQNTHRNPGGLTATPVLSYSENSPVSTSFTTNVPALQHTEAAAVLGHLHADLLAFTWKPSLAQTKPCSASYKLSCCSSVAAAGFPAAQTNWFEGKKLPKHFICVHQRSHQRARRRWLSVRRHEKSRCKRNNMGPIRKRHGWRTNRPLAFQ